MLFAPFTGFLAIFRIKLQNNDPKLPIVRLVSQIFHNIRAPALFSDRSRRTWMLTLFDPGFIYSELAPASDDHCPVTTCHCIFLTLYFHLPRIFRSSSRYYIPIRLFIRDTFFQLSPLHDCELTE